MTKAEKESGWAGFGQFVAIMAGIGASAFVLFLLLVSPYERHKEVVEKLSRVQQDQTTYYVCANGRQIVRSPSDCNQ